MKYSISLALAMYLSISFLITPTGKVENRIFFIRDTIEPDRGKNGSGWRIRSRTVTEKEIDNLIDSAIKETMQDLREKKLLTKSK